MEPNETPKADVQIGEEIDRILAPSSANPDWKPNPAFTQIYELIDTVMAGVDEQKALEADRRTPIETSEGKIISMMTPAESLLRAAMFDALEARARTGVNAAIVGSRADGGGEEEKKVARDAQLAAARADNHAEFVRQLMWCVIRERLIRQNVEFSDEDGVVRLSIAKGFTVILCPKDEPSPLERRGVDTNLGQIRSIEDLFKKLSALAGGDEDEDGSGGKAGNKDAEGKFGPN